MRSPVCFVLSFGTVFLAACATIGAGAGGGEAGARDSLEARRALAGMRHGAWESTYMPLPSPPTRSSEASRSCTPKTWPKTTSTRTCRRGPATFKIE